MIEKEYMVGINAIYSNNLQLHSGKAFPRPSPPTIVEVTNDEELKNLSTQLLEEITSGKVLEESSLDNSRVTPKRPTPENIPKHNYDKSSGDSLEMEKIAPYPERLK